MVFIKDKLLKIAEEKNIALGICDSEPLNYLEDIKEIPFINLDFETRTDCKKTFPDTKSIIVIGVPYGKKLNFKIDNAKRCKISIGAVGLDYHVLVKNILEDIIKELNSDFNYKIFSDTGPLIERELAKKSGIGFQGKNCCIVNKKYGSFIFLGYALVDTYIEPTEGFSSFENYCGECDLCQKSCPANALKNFSCNAFNCVSYLTQNKNELPEELKSKMSGYIYGCDICQLICPYNKDKAVSEITDINIVMPKIEFLKSLSNKEFKELYKNTAMFWRGKKTILRNVMIAEENKEKNV